MPYIKEEQRSLDLLPVALPETEGELNWVITSICDETMRWWDHDVSYATINKIIGVLECAKLEFYRRIAAPYEDIKCEQNGDVYNI